MPKKKDSTGTTAKKDSRKTSSSKVESPKTQPTARTTVAEPTKSTAPPPAAKPAEAAKPTPPAAPPPAVKSTPAAKAAAPVKTAPAKTAPAKSAAAKANPPVTIIVAKYDIGHGNNLYIRGEGAGLSWESGIQMENVGRDVWVWTTNQIAEGMVAFKFLINDEIWSTGDNLSASAGETTTLTPYF